MTDSQTKYAGMRKVPVFADEKVLYALYKVKSSPARITCYDVWPIV